MIMTFLAIHIICDRWSYWDDQLICRAKLAHLRLYLCTNTPVSPTWQFWNPPPKKKTRSGSSMSLRSLTSLTTYWAWLQERELVSPQGEVGLLVPSQRNKWIILWLVPRLRQICHGRPCWELMLQTIQLRASQAHNPFTPITVIPEGLFRSVTSSVFSFLLPVLCFLSSLSPTHFAKYLPWG